MTFSASAASILYCGLKPVFVDVDPKTLVISVDDLKKIHKRLCCRYRCSF